MLTWRKSWIFPYESILSITERFKFYNQLSVVTKKSMGPLWKEILDESIETKIANEDLSIPTLGNRKANNFSYSKVRICPICIRYGYHSYLHQFTLLSKCPFHSIKLISNCPACHIQQPYKRVNPNFSLYICQCGYEFTTEKSKKINEPYTSQIFDLSKSSLISWLESDLRARKSIQIFKIAGNIPLELFELIKNEKSNEKFVIKSYKYEREAGVSKPSLEKIYNSSRKITSAINRHLKHMLTYDELRNVRLISRNSPQEIIYTRELTIFILWKLHINMNHNLRAIENGRVKYPLVNEQPRFAAKLFDEILSDLYAKLQILQASEGDIETLLLSIYSKALIFEYNRISRLFPKEKIIAFDEIIYGKLNWLTDDLFLGMVIYPEKQNKYFIEEKIGG
jgi:hypothetical protein